MHSIALIKVNGMCRRYNILMACVNNIIKNAAIVEFTSTHVSSDVRFYYGADVYLAVVQRFAQQAPVLWNEMFRSLSCQCATRTSVVSNRPAAEFINDFSHRKTE